MEDAYIFGRRENLSTPTERSTVCQLQSLLSPNAICRRSSFLPFGLIYQMLTLKIGPLCHYITNSLVNASRTLRPKKQAPHTRCASKHPSSHLAERQTRPRTPWQFGKTALTGQRKALLKERLCSLESFKGHSLGSLVPRLTQVGRGTRLAHC